MSIAEFTKSPLTEVVCGVEFNAPEFSSVHFGLYWQTIRERFPSPPLERPPIGEIELLNIMPSLRRVWFESLDQKQLIQLQSNRFHYNWRRQSEGDDYPHFDQIYLRFQSEWQHFQQWCLTTENLTLQPISYELTYLNQIDKNLGWNDPSDTDKIFNFLEKWDLSQKKLIVFNSELEFELENNVGILSVTLNQRLKIPDNIPVMILNLTARSRSLNTTIESIESEKWFNLAHKYTVDRFLDLLREEIKQEWGLI